VGTGGYTPGFVDVYLNGAKLAPADFTATNGSDIVLASGGAANDILEVVAFQEFTVVDQTFSGDITFTGANYNLVWDASDDALEFRDTALKISSSADGQLDLDADTEIEITAPTVQINASSVFDVNGNIDVSGTVTGTGTSVFASLDISGDIDVDGTTNLDVVDIDGAATIDLADGVADNAYALTVKNREATDDRSYGLLVHAGSTNTDRALVINDHDGSNALFYVHGNGNVALGITNATEKFTVVNSSSGIVGRFTNNTNQTLDLGVISGSGSAGGVSFNNANSGYLSFQSGSTELVRMDASGNMGIGHAPSGNLTAGYVLRLDGGSQTYLAFNNDTHTTQVTGGFVIGNDGSSAYLVQRENQPLAFHTNDAERMRIKSNGTIKSVDAGTDNTRFGEDAGAALVSGANSNTLIGDVAGTSLTSPASFNVAVGHLALDADTKGDQSVAIGYAALSNQNFTSTTDSNNTAIGFMAGITVTSGQSNTIIGSNAGFYLSTGNNNTFLGMQAGTGISTNLLTGDRNIAIGANAGLVLQGAGAENVLIGAYAGDAIRTGTSNTIIGDNAGSGITTASGNVVIGHNAVNDGNCGNDNTVIGNNAGLLVTGSDNVIIGNDAGSNVTSGGGNIIIGDADGSAAGTAHQMIMGNSVVGVGQDNFTFGRGDTDSNIAFGATSITAPSDERYKENIQTSTAGLAFIKDLRPVTFQWKKEKDIPTDHEAYVKGSDTRVMLSNGETNHGFIAQEVKAVIDAHSELKDGFKMWSVEQREDAEGNPVENTRQRLAPSELIPMLTKAIQELSAKNDALEARIATLEAG
jgi:hypothetical protein